MWSVCDGSDYRVEETVSFTTFTECTTTTEIRNSGDEVIASKSGPADCPCEEHIQSDYSEIEGWSVVMWHNQEAKSHFQCLKDAGVTGSGTMPSTSGYGFTLEDITCDTWVGVCHGAATGTSNKGDENRTTFWKGEVMHFIDFEDGHHLRTKYLRGGDRNGPEWWYIGEDHYSNRMTSDGYVTGEGRCTSAEECSRTSFYTEDGEPNWPALYNWCPNVTTYPVWNLVAGRLDYGSGTD